MTDVFNPGGNKFVQIGSALVEADALHIVERLKEYDENLEVICLDPARANLNDAPFIICEKLPDGRLVRIFETWELTEDVLQRVDSANTHKFNVFNRLENMEQKAEEKKLSKYQDMRDKNIDIVETAVKVMYRKSSFTYKNEEGDKVTLHEDRPPTKQSV